MSVVYLVETESATPVAVQDLGIFVSKKKPVFVTQSQRASSLLLAELTSIGTLRISVGGPARKVRSTTMKPVKPAKLEYQDPSPKGFRKPPAPPQRPARIAASRKTLANEEVPITSSGPLVTSKEKKPRKGLVSSGEV